MITVFLLALAVVFAFFEWKRRGASKLYNFFSSLLAYILLLNVGIMSLLASVMHVFYGPETAEQIGWEPGSPFQFEIGMANLSYGILGILSFYLRGTFASATVIGWSILVLGCFVGHILNYVQEGNSHPWNIGSYVWVNDLFIPLLSLALLAYLFSKRPT